MLTIVAAVATNGVIGNSKLNKMPWYVPEELNFFKENTMGKIVVMGRKTAESTGKLRGRDCLVVSRDRRYKLQGFDTVTLEELLTMNERDFDKQYVVCGGADIYSQVMPYASHGLISFMDFSAKGDILMPKMEPGVWKRTSSYQGNRFTAFAYINTRRSEFAIK